MRMTGRNAGRNVYVFMWALLSAPLGAAKAGGDAAMDLYMARPQPLHANQIERNYSNDTVSKLSLALPPAQRAQSLKTLRSTEDAQVVDVISAINTGLLDIPTAQEIDFSKAASGRGVPRQLARLSMTLEGQKYVLWVSETGHDREGYRHVTAKVLNVADASAQFTITPERRVVGTLVTPQRSYRLVPAGDGTQIVYRFRQQSRSGKGHSVPAGQFAQAQKRHEQALMVADLQPKSVTVRQNGDKLHIDGGELGRFDPQVPLAENLRSLIPRLGALTNASDQDEFVITGQAPTRVRFKQLIGAVPVEARNEIGVRTDGTIAEVRLSVVSATRAPQGSPISKERAMQLASSAYAKKYGEPNALVELNDNPGLHYIVTPPGQPLVLAYRFGASAYGLEPAFVTINALNEEADIASSVSASINHPHADAKKPH